MTGRVHAAFVELLTRFAADVDDADVTALTRRARRDVTVAVRGRAGVGKHTVARALAAAGIAPDPAGDVDVHVIAEVAKPEDRAAIEVSGRPALVVLNKADLSGFGNRCRCQALTRRPTVAMVAHLAVARLDDELLTALSKLAAYPGELGAVDDFAAGGHPRIRRRLLDELDLFGVAQAVRALRAGADAAALHRVLRRASGVDNAVALLRPLLAEAGYQRVRSAQASLDALATTAGGRLAARIHTFLAADDTVVTCMAAAIGMMEAAGMTVDPGDDAAAHLGRAANWQRYRAGPVNAVHAAGGDAIVRGSLRLWRRSQTPRTPR